MCKLWVKFQAYNATQVSYEGCLNVDDFVVACKTKLPNKLGSFDSDQLMLSTTEGGFPLEPDILLIDINSQPGFTENSYRHPLFLSVTSGTTRGDFGILKSGDQTLQKYFDVAKKLGNSAVFAKLIAIMDDSTLFTNENHHPFIFVEGSSGMGKTQLAMTLFDQCSSGKVMYIVASSVTLLSQPIYKPFQCITDLFLKCLDLDFVILFPVSSARLNDDNIGIDQLKWLREPLYCFGFIFEFLKRGGHDGQTVEILPRTYAQVCTCFEQISFDFLTVILDEYPSFPQVKNDNELLGHSIKARLMRNLFLCFSSIRLILMGTDSRAGNMIQIAKQSRTQKINWCVIFPLNETVHPECVTSVLDDQEWLSNIIQHSRPWFAQLALQKISSASNLSLDDLAREIFVEASSQKGIFNEAYGQLGQISLFMNMYYMLSDEAGKDSSSVSIGRKSSLIHCHFGKLLENEPFTLTLVNSTLEHNGKPWRPLTVFPSFEKDILLYLCFMGGKNEMFAFKDKAGQRLSFAANVNRVLNQLEVGICFENNIQVSNDGMRAEALLAGSICLASHTEGFQGISVKLFIERLISELSPKDSYIMYSFIENDDSFYNIASRVDGLVNLKVPFLAPPNLIWPGFITSLQEDGVFNFGHFERTRNKDSIDIKLHCGISGESKDHQDLQLETMRGILKKVPLESKLHLVYVRKLNNSYFRGSYEMFLESNSSCKDLLIFKLVLSSSNTISLEPIKGMSNPNTTSVDSPRCLVIFIEKEQWL